MHPFSSPWKYQKTVTRILIAENFYFFLYISEKYVQFRKKQKKHLLGKIFGSPHTSNQFYLLQNCFTNYIYLKDMYITLTGINVCVSVKNVLICKFLNFMAVFTKNKNKLSRVAYIFRVRNLMSVWYI